jgi:ureidoglycolate lyase
MRAGSDAPDATALSVFVAAPGQAINYHANVWHLPMQVLDDEGLFAIYMFNDGTRGDVEFRDLPEAMGVVV